MTSQLLAAAVAGVVIVEVVAGCGPTRQQRIDAKALSSGQVRYVGRQLDAAARLLEEFGTLSVSSPLLVPAEPSQTRFSFDLAKGPDGYYDDARTQVQGRASVLDQESRSSSIDLSATLRPEAVFGYTEGLAKYREDLTHYQQRQAVKRRVAEADARAIRARAGGDEAEAKRWETAKAAYEAQLAGIPDVATRPTPPTTPVAPPPATTQPKQSEGTGNGGEKVGQSDPPDAAKPPDPKPKPDGSDHPQKSPADFFTDVAKAYASLFPNDGPSPTLANRAAINLAAGDTASEAIFALLGSPAEFVPFRDKRLLYGVSMVSVSPGHRTSVGHAGDVSLLVTYEYRPARRVVLEEMKERIADPILTQLCDEVLKDEQRLHAEGARERNGEALARLDVRVLYDERRIGQPKEPLTKPRRGSDGGASS